MRTGIAQTDVIDAFERLNLNDTSVDAGGIDPEELTAVYPVEAAWLGMESMILTSGGLDINAGLQQWRDVDAVLGQMGEAPTIAENRLYQTVSIALAGGAVTPIRVGLQLEVGGAAQWIDRFSLAAPGNLFYHNVFVPAGAVLRVRTMTNGGVGDTVIFTVVGLKTPRGVPLPMIPGLTWNEE